MNFKGTQRFTPQQDRNKQSSMVPALVEVSMMAPPVSQRDASRGGNPHLLARQSRPSELALQVHPLLNSIAGQQEIPSAYPPPFIFAHLPPSVCTSSDLLSRSPTPPVKILICPSWFSSKPNSLTGPSSSPAPNLCSPSHGDFSLFLKCIMLCLVWQISVPLSSPIKQSERRNLVWSLQEVPHLSTKAGALHRGCFIKRVAIQFLITYCPHLKSSEWKGHD